MSAEHFPFWNSKSTNSWNALPSSTVRGRHNPPIVDERSPAEDERGNGDGLRGQSHLPRDLALVRVSTAHHAGVAQGRATANLEELVFNALFSKYSK